MNGKPDVKIVLVRPRDARNVGAACRAMKTMGFESLAIVPEAIIDPFQARALAHFAAEVFDNARLFIHLKDAISEAALVVGTTRRRGKKRKYFTIFPEQLAERVASISEGTVAILFGNEETGLTDDELSLCHLAVTIPTDPDFPSLNLSHAVQIVCYELFRSSTRGRFTPFAPIPSLEVDALVSVITSSLKQVGFFTRAGPESTAVFFKDIIARAGLSVNEARRLGEMFKKIAGLSGKGRV